MASFEPADRDLQLAYPRGGADVLALGIGATALMWAVAYVGRMPLVMAPSWLIAVGLLVALIVGGFVTGKTTARGWVGGAAVGVIVGVLNQLVIGSIHSADSPMEYNKLWLLWVPGTIIGCAFFAACGAGLAGRRHLPRTTHWNFWLAIAVVCLTGLLLIAGGLVTSRDAGLAVPDWPASYGYNMFFYPLARMTGNIYFEHAHRLYGALVGMATIILAIHLWRNDRRKWMRTIVIIAVVAVVAQGVMGGFRVTGANQTQGIESAQPTHETALSTTLRIVHGVFAQLFFAFMVAIAVFNSRTWRSESRAVPNDAASTERGVTITLLVTLFLQLILGALVRHIRMEAMLHMSFAAIVFVLALAAALRAWGLHGNHFPALHRLGIALLTIATVQVGLGIAALVARGFEEKTATALTTAIRTAHQANGAALLGVATALCLLSFRLMTPPDRQQP